MENPEKELTPEALKIYDRQRFIGLDVQRRLLNSLIFLSPINGIITELAKNLVLCGCNLAFYDKDPISEEEINTNFLFSSQDLGKNKANTLKTKLLEMNPMVMIEIIDDFKEEELNKYKIIAISTGNFEEMRKWDRISKKINIPLYILNCCGFYGFFYASLGSEFVYLKKQKTQGILMEKAETKERKEDSKIEEICIKSINLEQTLEKPLKKRAKDVFLGIITEAKGIKYDPLTDSKEKEKEFVDLLRKTIEISEKQREFLEKFVRFYGLNFIPVYSVIGSVASQEFIKVIGRDQEPGNGWFCYDSEEGYGKFELFSEK